VLLNEKNNIIDQLNTKCAHLEDQLQRVLSSNSNMDNSNLDFHISALSNTLSQLNATTDQASLNNPTTKSLQNELERALSIIKQKRSEVASLNIEIEQLKKQLTSQNSDNDVEDTELVNNLRHELDELHKENCELQTELSEKRAKLDELLEQEEQYQHVKNNLEMGLFNKQQHIEECEKLVESLHLTINELQQQHQDPNQIIMMQQEIQQQFERDKQQVINTYEAQLAEYRLKLTNKEHETQKVS
jgi:chromosome segregation ATPase